MTANEASVQRTWIARFKTWSNTIRRSRVARLPAVGAVLVLATFATHDIVLDHYQDLATSADTARSLYEQGDQVGELGGSIDGITRVINPQRTIWQMNYLAFHQKWSEYNGQIKRLTELSHRVNDPSADAAKLADLQMQNANFNTLIENYGQAARTKPDEDAMPLSVQSGVIFKRSAELENELLGLAAQNAQDAATNAFLFRIVSGILFLGGWIVAFVGKAFQIPGMDMPSAL